MQILSMPLRHRTSPRPVDLWVLTLSVLVTVPHLLHLPIAVSVLCLLFWSLDLFLKSRRSRLSGMAKTVLILVGIFTFFLAVVKLATFRSAFDLLALLTTFQTVSALVVMLTAAKPLETYDRRGHRSFAIFCVVCALVFFFREGNGYWLLYYLVCFAGLTGLLFTAEMAGLKTGKALRQSLGLLVPAVPLGILLFIAIPRTESPFLERDGDGILSWGGISERVRLDRLGPMSESDEIAFEVTFEGEVPNPYSLYWRGAVLDYTNGQTWAGDFFVSLSMAPERLSLDEPGTVGSEEGDPSLLRSAGKTITYRIRSRSPSDEWLVVLDLPISQIESATLSEDYELYPLRRFGPNFEYEMTSALSIRTPVDPDRVYERALQLPARAQMAIRTREMGAELRARYEGQEGADQRIIQDVLRLFSGAFYHYTLEPPIYRSNPIDLFLFQTGYGYCTHYASAMTFLLRTAGVPARMISGYHGGDWNAEEEKLIVRKRHAHAWVEAWIEGYGWHRFDPTAAVSEDRVLSGGVPRSVLNYSEGLVSEGENADLWRQFLNPDQLSRLDTGFAGSSVQVLEADEKEFSRQPLLRFTRNFWSTWVIEFDHTLQRDLFQGGRAYFILGALLLGVIFLSIFFAVSRARRPSKRGEACRVGALYDRFCRRLQNAGMPVSPHESHQVLLQRLKQSGRFDLSLLEGFFVDYERLRYGRDSTRVSRQELRDLKNQLKRLLAGWDVGSITS